MISTCSLLPSGTKYIRCFLWHWLKFFHCPTVIISPALCLLSQRQMLHFSAPFALLFHYLQQLSSDAELIVIHGRKAIRVRAHGYVNMQVTSTGHMRQQGGCFWVSNSCMCVPGLHPPCCFFSFGFTHRTVNVANNIIVLPHLDICICVSTIAVSNVLTLTSSSYEITGMCTYALPTTICLCYNI